MQLRDEAYQKSQDAFNQGNHAAAKENSEKRKECAEKIKFHNSKAAEEIFRFHNPHPEHLEQVDLHGLFVEEAKEKVESHISRCKRAKLKQFKVVVGKGLHSVNGVPKLKFAIQELVETYHLRCTIDERNAGCLLVEFVSEKDQGFVGWAVEKVCLIM